MPDLGPGTQDEAPTCHAPSIPHSWTTSQTPNQPSTELYLAELVVYICNEFEHWQSIQAHRNSEEISDWCTNTADGPESDWLLRRTYNTVRVGKWAHCFWIGFAPLVSYIPTPERVVSSFVLPNPIGPDQ